MAPSHGGFEDRVEAKDLSDTERRKKILEIDNALRDFTSVMREKMIKNLHKEDWKTAPMDLLWRRAKMEMEELDIAMEYETAYDATRECADVANFAMILFTRFRNGAKTKREQMEKK